ncbi:sterol carrier family protein, partial [Bifidobacterium animalis]|uniref:sterol carrier family protein n=1 Tax=Bifidobacterium animalis TaxID=28025 RepID=UPI001D02A3AE
TAARAAAETTPALDITPRLDRATMAMAVRYSLRQLEIKAPGPGVEVRVAPYAVVKILAGTASDPHNHTHP